jgi:hypothetical protein
MPAIGAVSKKNHQGDRQHLAWLGRCPVRQRACGGGTGTYIAYVIKCEPAHRLRKTGWIRKPKGASHDTFG